MDPFQTLPPEIRQHIFCQVEKRIEVVKLTHASPAMFRQRIDYLSRTLAVYFRIMGFSDNRLQDAMAIILFPKRASDQEDDKGDYWDRVHRHLKQWAARGFPDPMRSYNIHVMDKLEYLCLQLNNYIKDFLSKATSSHLCQAYIHLPEWSHSSFKDNVGSVPSRAGDAINLDSLSPGEKSRILKAFLRYEILTKLFRPSQRPTWCTHDRIHRKGNRINYPASRWDWTMLDLYEGKSSEIWEIDGLQCVFEYFRTLYGAISARFYGLSVALEDWLYRHSDHLTASDMMNIGFKVTTFIKRNEHIKLTWVGATQINRFFDALALGGVDQATQLLMAGRDHAEHFFDYAASRAVTREEIFGLRELCKGRKGSNRKGTADSGPGVWSQRNPRKLRFRNSCYDAHKILLSTYRQRAWAFFDDERFYPETCHFHNLEEIGWIFGLQFDEIWPREQIRTEPEPRRTEPEPPRQPRETLQQVKQACENPDMWLLSPTAAYLKGRES